MENIASALRNRGFRVTPQRLGILKVLRNERGHLTPTEIYQRLKRELPGVTEATVYRTLSFLDEQEIVLAAHVGGGQIVYELVEDVHHHLICRSCGGVIEIGDDLVQEFYKKLYAVTGYRLDSRHITIFGKCPGCQPVD